MTFTPWADVNVRLRSGRAERSEGANACSPALLDAAAGTVATVSRAPLPLRCYGLGAGG
jgi:hypothetical protein